LEILEKDRKLRNRDLNAAINLLRLLVIELDGHERAVPLKPRA
jgi:transposase